MTAWEIVKLAFFCYLFLAAVGIAISWITWVDDPLWSPPDDGDAPMTRSLMAFIEWSSLNDEPQ